MDAQKDIFDENTSRVNAFDNKLSVEEDPQNDSVAMVGTKAPMMEKVQRNHMTPKFEHVEGTIGAVVIEEGTLGVVRSAPAKLKEGDDDGDDDIIIPRKLVPPLQGNTIENDGNKEEVPRRKRNRSRRLRSRASSGSNSSISMSAEDIEICQKLDLEYERALEEREIGYNARFHSVRQSACFSISFMIFYLSVGVTYFTRCAGWNFRDAVFFSVYTITTVGYGINNRVEDVVGFQLFIIFFIFVGIATLTIMVAQVYQCIALEATRAQHARDKAGVARRGKDLLVTSTHKASGVIRNPKYSSGAVLEMEQDISRSSAIEQAREVFSKFFKRVKGFFRDTELGRGISVIFPLGGLVLVGAAFVGPIEGWGIIESIYFACVSLTTVGYGLYVPQHPVSVWFCIIWLPFSVGFMSIFLGNIASFYIRLSDKNIHRLERHMRHKIRIAKEEAEKERALVLARAYRGQIDPSVDLGSADAILRHRRPKGFEFVSKNEDDALFGSANASAGEVRRQKILRNSTYSSNDADDSLRPAGQTMQTMRDILVAVRKNLAHATVKADGGAPQINWEKANSSLRLQQMEYLSVKSTRMHNTPSLGNRRGSMRRKPSFALRALVQERFAEIIATDIAGFQSHIEIQDNTLSVTINTLKQTADKWRVPRRARKAFRAVAFEALYFVGERGLITRGADALYDLSPFEFHGLFSPLLAAMGDAEGMEGWLAHTDILADVDLRRDSSKSTPEQGGKKDSKTAEDAINAHMEQVIVRTPTKHMATIGNAFVQKQQQQQQQQQEA